VVVDGYAGSWFIGDSSLPAIVRVMAEGEGTSVPQQEQEARKRSWQRGPRKRTLRSKLWDRTGLRGKTLWDWLELLLIPLILGTFGLFWTTAQEDERQQAIEAQRAQDAALQAYLNQMSEALLRENSLRAPGADNDEVRALARARTLMILRTVDPQHQAEVMKFLLDANLVQATDGRTPAIRLSGADLWGIYMPNADLSNAQLDNTDLRFANLSNVNLSDANLSDANLSDADLRGADLRGADLSEADLSGATGWTEGQLTAARSLEGASMPDGQKYEDWLKSQGSGEDGENQ
jgi:hypothetical protein